MTRDWCDHFALEGWAVARGLVSPVEIEALREETAALITRGHPERAADPTFQYGPDPRQPGRFAFFRVNDLLNVHNLQNVQRLLGHPGLLARVSELVGRAPFVSSTETLVFKLPGCGFGHRWHQDPPYIRHFPSVMAGIYLDRSTEANGGLRVLSRSHLSGYWGDEDWVNALTGGPFGEPTGLTYVTAEPGDVVFHATTLVHGSLWNDAPELRRTIYFQFDHFRDVRLQEPGFWTRRGYLAGQGRLRRAVLARREAFPEEAAYALQFVASEDLA